MPLTKSLKGWCWKQSLKRQVCSRAFVLERAGICSLTQAAEHLHVCCSALALPQTDSGQLCLQMVERLVLTGWQAHVRPSCNRSVLQILPSAWKIWWTFERHQGLREGSSTKVALDTAPSWQLRCFRLMSFHEVTWTHTFLLSADHKKDSSAENRPRQRNIPTEPRQSSQHPPRRVGTPCASW